jgi:predicted ribosomally synthesized peptide with SipW-like signal peptide
MITKALASVLVLVMMGGAMTLGTNAVFSDTATLGTNSFQTGTIDISTSPASALFTVSAMMPGDSVTQPLTVNNDGSAELRYAISASATDPDSQALKDQLTLTIKSVDSTTPGVPCDDFDGTQLYSGDLDGTTGALVGDNSQGAQAGDRVIAASSSEVLCFQVSLPLATGNSAQDTSTEATFTFDAEQTANN